MTVENMRSPRGNQVPNQFIIWADEGKYFQSYRVIIAFIDNNGKVFLDKDYWDYSRTTGKYRNIFLGEKRDNTVRSIRTGEYELKDLNMGPSFMAQPGDVYLLNTSKPHSVSPPTDDSILRTAFCLSTNSFTFSEVEEMLADK